MTPEQNDSNDDWNQVDSPTDQTLHDVVLAASGPYAVGENGHLLAKQDDGWNPILERGPKVDSNTLRSAAVSEDGKHVWFTGDSGVLARYRSTESKKGDTLTKTNQLADYTGTYDITTTWENIAVIGAAGEERILLSNASGEILCGENDNGNLSYGEMIEPGGGSSLSGFDFIDGSKGYVCDTNGTVYETTDGGTNYEIIGAREAPALNGISVANPENITAIGANGNIFSYNGNIWTEQYVGDEELTGIDLNQEKNTGLICGSNGGIYFLEQDGWTHSTTPVTERLNSVLLDPDEAYLAVGTNGTIVKK